jgi:DNA (cytosine-5)-methyltransferase 1
LKFIDLFAGLGGFHLALKRLGYKCVFACEIDEDLRKTYKKNFSILPYGDLKSLQIKKIPKHDILCAGFPCQPFSKAGDQRGLDCPKWGNLFEYVIKILKRHRPAYFILENVPNLARHQDGDTWKSMRNELELLGYAVAEERFSPHHFGIPQIRDRIYIVGSRGGLAGFEWPNKSHSVDTSIVSALERNPEDAKSLSDQVVRCLSVWQEFIRLFPKDEELPSFPIWSMEFGATYPYKNTTPYAVGVGRLSRYLGSHGKELKELSQDDRWAAIPSYARTNENIFPKWKIDFIRQNRELYCRHKKWIDSWKKKILEFPPSLQKLEWNCKGGNRDIWKYIIQFRASGVRVKRPTTSPSLVAMTTTQVPIVGWEKRYMTARECANLQSLNQLKYLPTPSSKAFKALGNAVNAEVVEHIARALFNHRSCD